MDCEDQTRVAALRRLNILDSAPERSFDMLVCAAAALAQVPMALVSFVDERRQWFKARIGIDVQETALATSFCTHAIRSRDALFEVRDARFDDRFRDYPIVTGRPNVRFYAGAALRMRDGTRVGTLCVLDDKPRETLSSRQQEGLIALAELAGTMLHARGAIG